MNNEDIISSLEQLIKENGPYDYILPIVFQASIDAIKENERYREALNEILELESPNLEGWETEIHKIAREALGINEKRIFWRVVKVNKLIKNIEQWSTDKGLDKAESSKQFLKVVEEVGEVASALAKGKQAELKDGIGDVVVTLVILAQQNGLTLEECVQAAYDEIKGRTGKMVDGVFVKSSDL